MQINEFIEATSRLEKYYNKEYTTAQLDIMYEELKDFSIERYRQLISAAIRKCTIKPKVADFYTIDSEMPRTKDEPNEEIEECKKCKKTGYVTYKKYITDGGKKIEYIYAARCNCTNGNLASKRVPTVEQIGLRI